VSLTNCRSAWSAPRVTQLTEADEAGGQRFAEALAPLRVELAHAGIDARELLGVPPVVGQHQLPPWLRPRLADAVAAVDVDAVLPVNPPAPDPYSPPAPATP
jgi:hypothetical protein